MIEVLPVWDAVLHDPTALDGIVGLQLQQKQTTSRAVSYPVAVTIGSSWSIAPNCGFSFDYRYEAEQTARMLDWENSWIDVNHQFELWQKQQQINRLLEEFILGSLDPRVKLYGYLVGKYGGKYSGCFHLKPVWKAQELILRLHYAEMDILSSTEFWQPEHTDTLTEYTAELAEHFQQKFSYPNSECEDYVIVPLRILPKELRELERDVENEIFPRV